MERDIVVDDLIRSSLRLTDDWRIDQLLFDSSSWMCTYPIQGGCWYVLRRGRQGRCMIIVGRGAGVTWIYFSFGVLWYPYDNPVFC